MPLSKKLKNIATTASLIGTLAATSVFGVKAQEPQQQTVSQTQEQTYEPIINLGEFEDIVPLKEGLMKDYPNYNINNVTLEDPGTHCFNFFVIPPTLDGIKLIYVGEDYETFLEYDNLDSIIDDLFNEGIRNYDEIEYDRIAVAKTTLPFLKNVSGKYPNSEVADDALYLMGQICLRTGDSFSSSESREEMEQRIKNFKEYGIIVVGQGFGESPNSFGSSYNFEAFRRLEKNYPTSELVDDAAYELIYCPPYTQDILKNRLKEFTKKYPNSNKRKQAEENLRTGIEVE